MEEETIYIHYMYNDSTQMALLYTSDNPEFDGVLEPGYRLVTKEEMDEISAGLTPPEGIIDDQAELDWRNEKLRLVLIEITNYSNDKLIPEEFSELRMTKYTEDDYYKLLGDRKLLIEYAEQEDFPYCGRPLLSGLV